MFNKHFLNFRYSFCFPVFMIMRVLDTAGGKTDT